MLLGLSCLGTRSVRSERITVRRIVMCATAGAVLFFGCDLLLHLHLGTAATGFLYTATLGAGYIGLLTAGIWLGRLLSGGMTDDPFNDENESFMQETRLIQNEYSVNLPTLFYYGKRWNSGWINVVNPFRASVVLGTPGSGKSYAVVNNYIKQMIEKGFALYIYDFKFDDLSVIAYNHLRTHLHCYKVPPKFYVINFDDPRRSHRCNPIDARFMTDISDAYESAYTIMLNLNKTWITKQGDFFVESPIILLAAVIWFLKIYEDGRYCNLPARYRTAEQALCRPVHDPHRASLARKLPFALHGCMERRSAGPVAGPDRLGQDTALAHDLAPALLGDDGR